MQKLRRRKITLNPALGKVFFPLIWLLFFAANSSFGQAETPIGRHYAQPIMLAEPDSEHDLLMWLPKVLDINGDGKNDLAYSATVEDWSGPSPSTLYIWTANDEGSMDLETYSQLEGANWFFRQILPADFNGDGKLDLFLASHGPEPDCGDGTVHCWTGAQNSLLLTNSEGQLVDVTSTHLPALVDFTHGASLADFDGDGDVDIWVNNLRGSPLYDPEFPYLLHNDGLGSFTVVADISKANDTPIIGSNGILPPREVLDQTGFWSFSIDVDGDNDIDLCLASVEAQDGGLLLRNDGAGILIDLMVSSWPMPSVPSPPAVVQHALNYDLNNDGLDDLLLHQTDLNKNRIIQILINNGDGTFRDESATRYPGPPVVVLGDFQLHDLDGDGHKDLFTSVNYETADIRVNDGEGNFRQLAVDWVVQDWNWVVLDSDGDGGTDFFTEAWYGVVLNKMNLPYGPALDGTSEDDRLIGGAHDNVYRGFEGNDVLDGGLGNDLLEGGKGDDSLIGGKGRDTYILSAEDLAGQDNIVDKQGIDTLKFADFGLERIANTSQDVDGNLVFAFTDGGFMTVVWHFDPSHSNYGLEVLRVGASCYEILKDPGFTSGPVQDILEDCHFYKDGFEGQ